MLPISCTCSSFEAVDFSTPPTTPLFATPPTHVTEADNEMRRSPRTTPRRVTTTRCGTPAPDSRNGSPRTIRTNRNSPSPSRDRRRDSPPSTTLSDAQKVMRRRPRLPGMKEALFGRGLAKHQMRRAVAKGKAKLKRLIRADDKSSGAPRRRARKRRSANKSYSSSGSSRAEARVQSWVRNRGSAEGYAGFQLRAQLGGAEESGEWPSIDFSRPQAESTPPTGSRNCRRVKVPSVTESLAHEVSREEDEVESEASERPKKRSPTRRGRYSATAETESEDENETAKEPTTTPSRWLPWRKTPAKSKSPTKQKESPAKRPPTPLQSAALDAELVDPSPPLYPDSPTPHPRTRLNGPPPPSFVCSKKIGTTHVLTIQNSPLHARRPISQPDIFTSFRTNRRSKGGYAGSTRTRPHTKDGDLMTRLSEDFVAATSPTSATSGISEGHVWEGSLYPEVVEQMRIDDNILNELEHSDLVHLIFVMADKIKSEEQAGKSKAAYISQLEGELGREVPEADVPVITVQNHESPVRQTPVDIVQDAAEERGPENRQDENNTDKDEGSQTDEPVEGNKELSHLREEVIAKDAQIKDLQRDLASAAKLHAQLEDSHDFMTRLKAEAEERERINVSLLAELDSRDAQVAKLNQALEVQDAEIAHLASAAEERIVQLAELTQRLEEMENSEYDRFADASSEASVAESSFDSTPSLRARTSTRELLSGLEFLRDANSQILADLASVTAKLKRAESELEASQRRVAVLEAEIDQVRDERDRALSSMGKMKAVASNGQVQERMKRAHSPPSPPSSTPSLSHSPSSTPPTSLSSATGARPALVISLTSELETATSRIAALESELATAQLALESSRLEVSKLTRLSATLESESTSLRAELIESRSEVQKLRQASANSDLEVVGLKKAVEGLELKNEEMSVLLQSYEIERRLQTPKGTPRHTPRGTPRTPRTVGTMGTVGSTQRSTRNGTGRTESRASARTDSRMSMRDGAETPTPTPRRATSKLSTPQPLPKRIQSETSRKTPREGERKVSQPRKPLRMSTRANETGSATEGDESRRSSSGKKVATGSKIPRSSMRAGTPS